MGPRSSPSDRTRGALVGEAQRIRILSAMVEVASEHGRDSATVARVVARAGVSRKTFYDLFEDRDDCLRAVLEDGVVRGLDRAKTTDDPHAPWVDRLRGGLSAWLALIDEEPELARVCVAQALANPSMLNGRWEELDQLTQLIDEGRTRAPASRKPPPLAAQGVLGGVLGLVYARLITRDARSFLELLNPSMAIIVLPYLGRAAAERELRRPVPPRPPASPKPKPIGGSREDLELRLTYRTLAVLEVIEAEPGLSNRDISDRAGVIDQGQISKLLRRLDGHRLVENFGAGQAQGAANAWRITSKGKALLRGVASLR